jgi:hypothetical protein
MRCCKISSKKRPLGRSRCRGVDNTKMDVGERGGGRMDWIDLAENRDQWRTLVNTVMNLWVVKIAAKFFSGHVIGSFSRRAQLHEFSPLVN